MMNTAQAMSAPISYEMPISPPSMLMIVAVAVTCEATVPIIVNAIRQPSTTLAVFPKRCSNRSGMDVTLNFRPTSEMRPAKPEKINIPSRYGSAVMMALKPLEYATPARPIRPLPPMIVAQTVAIRTSGPNERPPR